jgi:phosphatidylinositol alpha-1,6-mannosyltransferase
VAEAGFEVATAAGVLRLAHGRSVWMVSRKALPGVGGMERLSAQVVAEVGRLVPVTAIARNAAPPAVPAFVIAAAVRLVGGLLRGRVALLHLHDPVLAPLGWIARAFGVPVVMTLHGLDVTYPHALYRLWFRVLARRCDAYVCISAHTASLAAAAGIARERLHVVPVGVTAVPPDPLPADDSWTWPSAAPLLVTVGRLVERKGVRWFVDEVLPPLVERVPDLHYAIAGSGPEDMPIRETARRRGLDGRVHLLGEVPEDEKWALLRRATVVVMPNVPVPGDAEGFGIAALEAAQAGRPLVAADLEGLRDAVIDRRTGVRVPAGDAAAWTRALATLLARATLAGALGRRAARGVAAHFDWDRIARRYLEVYRDALECREALECSK